MPGLTTRVTFSRSAPKTSTGICVVLGKKAGLGLAEAAGAVATAGEVEGCMIIA